ncbi:MAG: hypothetical protein PHP95_04140 [Desulfuromonadaceae bacterium]|nr:hypothetical protein [Desulfuromonadaceae bacterium]MDD2847626.1 hypothetical protein [Desulfuromonadaceae bacterium]MDD4131128.1 hypothetical protein [Desulfuromonadaceae bacterium]
MKKDFSPFKNESDYIQIGELTIENRIDRVSIYGSTDITLDKVGLVVAKELKAIIDSVLTDMEKVNLPDRIAIAPVETVDNPFA